MIDLFSSSHIESAKILFPEKVDNQKWLKKIWSEDEIISCKNYEFRNFIKSKSIEQFPFKEEYLKLSVGSEIGYSLGRTVENVDSLISMNKDINNVISIGCGVGIKEIWLSKRHPKVHFYCSDIVPYVKILNRVVKNLNITNVTFCESKDIEKLQKNITFDLVYCDSVIYCISNKFLKDFFKYLSKLCKRNGLIIIGDSSNLSFMGIIRYYIMNLLQVRFLFFEKKIHKKTGWLRSWKYIRKFVPEELSILKVGFYKHQSQILLFKKLKLLLFPIYIFSKYIYPISNGSYFFIIRNNKKN